MKTLQQHAQELAANGSLWVPELGSYHDQITYYAEERARIGNLANGNYVLMVSGWGEANTITVINPGDELDTSLKGVFYGVPVSLMVEWGDVLPLYMDEHESRFFDDAEGNPFPDGIWWMGDAGSNGYCGVALGLLLGRNKV